MDVSGVSSALRARRLAARLSQEELADRSRLSERTIRNLENGTAKRPHRDTLHAVARGLDLTGAAVEDFVRAWRPARSSAVLGDGVHDDAVAGELIEQRHRIRDVAASHTVVVGVSGRWRRSITRRWFEAVEPGVDTFAWMVSYDPAVMDPALLTVGDCVNLEPIDEIALPDAGAKAFVGRLGRELAVGESCSVECVVDNRAADVPARAVGSENEILFAAAVGFHFLSIEVRFDAAALPSRVVAVRRPAVDADGPDDHDGDYDVALSPFGIAQLVVTPAPGHVYGLRWEWGATHT